MLRMSSSTSRDRKSTRLNSSHGYISYAVFCLKKKKLPAALSSGMRFQISSPTVVLEGRTTIPRNLADILAAILQETDIVLTYRLPRLVRLLLEYIVQLYLSRSMCR